MSRTVLIALALGMLAGACERQDATVSEPATDTTNAAQAGGDPEGATGKQELLGTQPQVKSEPASTGNDPATADQTGAPTSSGDTATINSQTEGVEKETNVESASEQTEGAGDTATIN